jgi:hypothetical protein
MPEPTRDDRAGIGSASNRRYLSKLFNEIDAQARAEGEAKGRAEGRVEGRAEGRAGALVTILRANGVAVSDSVRERIAACADSEVLDAWIARVATTAVIRDVDDVLRADGA